MLNGALLNIVGSSLFQPSFGSSIARLEEAFPARGLFVSLFDPVLLLDVKTIFKLLSSPIIPN